MVLAHNTLVGGLNDTLCVGKKYFRRGQNITCWSGTKLEGEILCSAPSGAIIGVVPRFK